MTQTSAGELDHLIAFHRREGFTLERMEIASAQIAKVVAEAHKKKGTTIKLSDFLPFDRAWEDLEAELNPVQHEIDYYKRTFESAGLTVEVVERS